MASALAALASLGAPFKPRRCGYVYDCPRNYTLADVNASAATWVEGDGALTERLAGVAAQAEQLCAGRGKKTDVGRCAEPGPACPYLNHGGWCLDDKKGLDTVVLPHGQSYTVPKHHAKADGIVVAALAAILSGALSGNCSSGRTPLSINDFGAGVGQYGHSLLSLQPDVRWRGYDGAGNVVAYTSGFVSFFDLAIPLSFPRADWVVSLEVCRACVQREHPVGTWSVRAVLARSLSPPEIVVALFRPL